MPADNRKRAPRSDGAVVAGARGLRRGQYLAGLEFALHGIRTAERYLDALPIEERKALSAAHGILTGLAQRGWAVKP